MKLKVATVRKELKNLEARNYNAGSHNIPRVWIVVSDKERAQFFCKVGESLDMIGEAIPSEKKISVHDSEMHIINPLDNMNPIKYELSMSPARRRAFKFAHEIAHWLDQMLEKESFDRLVLIAPPQMLRDLREALGKPAFSRLMAEINRSLTKMNDKELYLSLEKTVWL